MVSESGRSLEIGDEFLELDVELAIYAQNVTPVKNRTVLNLTIIEEYSIRRARILNVDMAVAGRYHEMAHHAAVAGNTNSSCGSRPAVIRVWGGVWGATKTLSRRPVSCH